MKYKILNLLILAFLFSCTKNDDTSNTTTTTGTTSSNATNTLTVDGSNWSSNIIGIDTSSGDISLYYIGTNGSCEIFFASPNPPTGNYSSNWKTQLQSNQCKLLLRGPQPNGYTYYSEDGATVSFTNNGNGKAHIKFSNITFIEMVNDTPRAGRKVVSGDFGN